MLTRLTGRNFKRFGGGEASIRNAGAILERRTGQHCWCNTKAIGFLPPAVRLSRRQFECQLHGTYL